MASSLVALISRRVSRRALNYSKPFASTCCLTLTRTMWTNIVLQVGRVDVSAAFPQQVRARQHVDEWTLISSAVE